MNKTAGGLFELFLGKLKVEFKGIDEYEEEEDEKDEKDDAEEDDDDEVVFRGGVAGRSIRGRESLDKDDLADEGELSI